MSKMAPPVVVDIKDITIRFDTENESSTELKLAVTYTFGKKEKQCLFLGKYTDDHKFRLTTDTEKLYPFYATFDEYDEPFELLSFVDSLTSQVYEKWSTQPN